MYPPPPPYESISGTEGQIGLLHDFILKKLEETGGSSLLEVFIFYTEK